MDGLRVDDVFLLKTYRRSVECRVENCIIQCSIMHFSRRRMSFRTTVRNNKKKMSIYYHHHRYIVDGPLKEKYYIGL